VRGLPERPPKSEVILWQGALHLGAGARCLWACAGSWAYFAVIVLWRASVAGMDGGLAGAFAFGLPYAILAALAAVVVLLLAWGGAQTTVYTITTARVPCGSARR
jgi:hypothetical protein